MLAASFYIIIIIIIPNVKLRKEHWQGFFLDLRNSLLYG
jgi:hypothetical protein